MSTTTPLPAASPVFPRTLPPKFENIPAELRALKQWIVWAHTWKEAEKKWAKVPYSPATGANASSTDPATWGTFEEAVAAYTASRSNPNDNFDGVGFVFTGTPYMGVDQDHVLEGDALAPAAQRIVAELATYTEVSPSGTGVKSFLRARKPGNAWSKITGLGLEMYDESRYFTMTGYILDGLPAEPQERQDQVDALYYRILAERAKPATSAPTSAAAPTAPAMSDDEVVQRVVGSANAGKFMKLMAGDITGYPGDSEADMALAGILTFWTADAEQIERIMRRAKLERSKWDTSRPGGTYISTTIEKALEARTAAYTGNVPVLELGLRPLNTLAMKPVPWLWPGYLPLGATSLLVGDPGNGKTLSGLDLLARVTVGAAWPDGVPNTFGPRNVIVLSAEDSNEYTIRPRIEAAGGDSSRVFVVPSDKVGKLSLQTGVEQLRRAIEKYDPLVILIDPLSAYMPGIDTYRDNEVRSSLTPFVALLDQHGVACIAIVHMSKNIERNAMQRFLGSVAFTALSRSTFMVSRDPDAHEGDDTRRFFLPLKFNLGREPEGRAFKIVSTKVKGDSVQIDTPVAQWEAGAVNADANEVLRHLQNPSDRRREVRTALLEMLKDGPVLVKDAQEQLDLKEAALRRLRDKLRVMSVKDPADAMHGPYYLLPQDWDAKTREAWERERMAMREPAQ
jgi:hypothetical protein